MPPLRTTKPISAVKTERSHAENQERAYIAASRRSDRSLEARVESARRASEIHKRRTGRSLRVTEEDVLNEEMYEEEDDRLPLQYQRLAAHLDIGSARFKARLAAYLTNHVAMRNAMAAVHQNAANHQHMHAFHSPPITPSSEHLCPQTPYGSAPYPSPPMQAENMPPASHLSAINSPTLVPHHQPIHYSQMPVPSAAVHQNASNPAHMQSHSPHCDPAYHNQPQPPSLPPSPQYQQAFLTPISPFNTALPGGEPQQIVGHTPDMADSFQTSLMHSSPPPGNIATFGGAGVGIHTNDWLDLEGANHSEFADLLTFTNSPGGGS